MHDSDRLIQFASIIQRMRAAQRDYWAKGSTSVVECKRLEAAADRWLDENGFTKQRQLFTVDDQSRVTSVRSIH